MNDLLIEMMSHYGLKEIFGPNHNPEIIKMFKEIGFDWVKDDETAWCSASLNYFCKLKGYERSGELNARSWLKMPVEIEKPMIGDVVIFWRNKKEGWEGHVGLYINSDMDEIYCLGGNQKNMICIDAYPRERVLGYRRLRKYADLQP